MAEDFKKLVAVVIPLSDREKFTPDEEISFRHVMHFLSKYDKYLVAPDGLAVERESFGIEYFNKRFFGSLQAHTKLMLSPEFYERFNQYKYLLLYHLDSLVFSDELIQWCEKGYDFIGPPWIKFDGAPYSGITEIENKVGNGGFSLRKIESFLKVIYSKKYSIEPSEYWQETYASKEKYKQLINLPKKLLKHVKVFNNARWEMSRCVYNEDIFWTSRASHFYPEFNIAPLEIALRFAFECGPRICFEKTDQTLPFGCHAWHKYDREFWEPHLLK